MADRFIAELTPFGDGEIEARIYRLAAGRPRLAILAIGTAGWVEDLLVKANANGAIPAPDGKTIHFIGTVSRKAKPGTAYANRRPRDPEREAREARHRSIVCPTCGAPVGAPCRSMNVRNSAKSQTGTHVARMRNAPGGQNAVGSGPYA